MVDTSETGKYFEYAKDLILEAGKIIEQALDIKKNVEFKDGKWDVITDYGKEIEKILIDGLSTKFPGHKFIAKETSSIQNFTSELTDKPTWIIDPIDGILNFVHSYPQTCISIGLTIKKQLQLGIIYNPLNQELYTAQKNQGAFLHDKRLQTSKTKELKRALISIEPSTLHLSLKNRDIVQGRYEALATEAQGIRNIGSAALTLAYVARGILDGFQYTDLKLWDVAAGVLLVEEAGGIVCDSKGGSYDVTKSNLVAAASPELVSEITKLIVETDLKTQRKRFKRI